jgi:hypothetical protein
MIIIAYVAESETWVCSWPDSSYTPMGSAQQALDEAMAAGYTRFEIRGER